MSVHNERLEEMATAVWNQVFHMLDGEIDFTTDDACAAANAARAAFERSVADWLHPLCKVPDGWGFDPQGLHRDSIAGRLHLEINGLNATMRATSKEYRDSTLCHSLSDLIRDNAKAHSAGN